MFWLIACGDCGWLRGWVWAVLWVVFDVGCAECCVWLLVSGSGGLIDLVLGGLRLCCIVSGFLPICSGVGLCNVVSGC